MVEKGRRPGKRDTRAEIIDAARRVFGQVGYDRASLRAIASEAGVDPALIHHYFEGGKPILFAESMHLGTDPHAVVQQVDRAVAGAGARPARRPRSARPSWPGSWACGIRPTSRPTCAGGHLLRHLRAGRLGLAGRRRRRAGVPGRTHLVQGRGPGHPGRRAHRLRNQSLVASQLMGLGFARYVLRLEALVDASPEELANWVGPTLDRYITSRPTRLAG